MNHVIISFRDIPIYFANDRFLDHQRGKCVRSIFIIMAKGFLNITKWSVFPELASNHREIESFQGNKNWSILWSFRDGKFDSVLLELERQFREIICDRFKKIGISIEKHRNETSFIYLGLKIRENVMWFPSMTETGLFNNALVNSLLSFST